MIDVLKIHQPSEVRLLLPCSCNLGLQQCHDELTKVQYSDDTLDARKQLVRWFSTKKCKLDIGRLFFKLFSSLKCASFSPLYHLTLPIQALANVLICLFSL